jgi:hypothetical protein
MSAMACLTRDETTHVPLTVSKHCSGRYLLGEWKADVAGPMTSTPSIRRFVVWDAEDDVHIEYNSASSKPVPLPTDRTRPDWVLSHKLAVIVRSRVEERLIQQSGWREGVFVSVGRYIDNTGYPSSIAGIRVRSIYVTV